MAKKKTEPTATHPVLIILRHAHRDTSQGNHQDNGLSEKGWGQAKKIRKYYEKTLNHPKRKGAPQVAPQVAPMILSSPKIRCIETVEKLAKSAKTEIQISELLDEGGDLLGKTLKLSRELLETTHPLTILCSHGDVIPILLHRLTGSEIFLSKGGWIQLERLGGQYHLQWILQELP